MTLHRPARPTHRSLHGTVHELSLDDELRAPWDEVRPPSSFDARRARSALVAELKLVLGATRVAGDRAFFKRLGRSLKAADLELPPFPTTVARLGEALHRGSSTSSTLAELVSQDHALVGEVWRCAARRQGRAPEGLPAAITCIGHDELWRIGLRVSLARSVFRAEGFEDEVQALRHHAHVVGELARWLSTEDRGRAYVAGLLHDAGRMVVYRAAARGPRPSPAALRLALDSWEAPLGLLLARIWSLGTEIAAAVGFHHHPLLGPRPRLASCLRAADIAAELAASPSPALQLHAEHTLSEELGLDARSMERLLQRADLLHRATP